MEARGINVISGSYDAYLLSLLFSPLLSFHCALPLFDQIAVAEAEEELLTEISSHEFNATAPFNPAFKTPLNSSPTNINCTVSLH